MKTADKQFGRRLCPGLRIGFTLIELLVVIAIIGMLLAIDMPALRKAKESAQGVVCQNHLRTLALSNEIYASRSDQWYVPIIDTTMTPRGEPTWNSNLVFREIVGLEDASVGSSYVLPKEYLCPSDRQSTEAYWSQAGVTYENFVSYGYNLTDWGPSSRSPVNWSGNIPAGDWACRFRAGQIRSSAEKIMFSDAGDIWVRKAGADYRKYWDQYGQDIVKYRQAGMWQPVYYRHKEGVNLAYFDGHVDFQRKENLFAYTDPAGTSPDSERNDQLWFCIAGNRKSPMP